ncbi:succinate dehydrogenase assembly factor 2 [Endozoicomonas sp. Mp262]|uniref:FAD assembly factor SdhE n=1 Tax=Endozoicomonas sp. Mp262 TaxID=2919499 RepID=UPI0021D8893C
MGFSEDDVKRLQWRSRRGMLELDFLLEPFTREAFCSLSEDEQVVYSRLLECEDPDLFSWFMSDQKPADPELAKMVQKVLQRGRYGEGAA